MTELKLKVPENLYTKLQTLSSETGEFLEDILIKALVNYISYYQFLRDVFSTESERLDLWQDIKKTLQDQDDSLKDLSERKANEIFDKLSKKAAQNLPYENWEDMENFLRRRIEYDFN